ncbi:MAG: erythromycin esterase family protein [Planctomycetes bacterium]|nr:erythromycin esterase family protein [Planctomycetota bacterium]
MCRIAAVALLFVILQSGNSGGAASSNPASRPESLPESMPAASRAALLEDLRQRAHSLKSIDPDDENMNDLKPIGEAVKDAKIVVLGEIHGDTNSYLIKSRIIKYLHEHLNFNVLAFEAPMFTGIELGRKMEKDCSVEEMLQSKVFQSPWRHAVDLEPLWKYLLNTQKTGRPLRFCGMDSKFYEERGSDVCPALPYFQAIFQSTGGDPLGADDWKFINIVLQGKLTIEKRVPESFDRVERLIRCVVEAIRERESLITKAKSAVEFELLRRLAANMGSSFEWMYGRRASASASIGSFTNPRDAAMADNTEWLQRYYYSNARTFVWVGGFHIGSDSDRWSEDGAPEKLNEWIGLRSASQCLRNKYGKEVYTIGISARIGAYAVYEARDEPPIPIGQCDGESFEKLMVDAGLTSAFMNFRALPPTHWLRTHTINSNVFQPRPIRSVLTEAVDGVIYLNEASPATYDEPEEPASRGK